MHGAGKAKHSSIQQDTTLAELFNGLCCLACGYKGVYTLQTPPYGQDIRHGANPAVYAMEILQAEKS